MVGAIETYANAFFNEEDEEASYEYE